MQELEALKNHPAADQHEREETEALGKIATYSLHFCELAHGLRNMSAVVLGHCELLEPEVSTNGIARKRLEAITKAAHAMSERLDSAQCAAGGLLEPDRSRDNRQANGSDHSD